VIGSTAQNSSNNLSSYPPDNHQSLKRYCLLQRRDEWDAWVCLSNEWMNEWMDEWWVMLLFTAITHGLRGVTMCLLCKKTKTLITGPDYDDALESTHLCNEKETKLNIRWQILQTRVVSRPRTTELACCVLSLVHTGDSSRRTVYSRRFRRLYNVRRLESPVWTRL